MFIKIKKIFYLPIKWMIKEIIRRRKLEVRPVSLIMEEYRKAKEELLEAERVGKPNNILIAKAKIDFIEWLLIKKQ